MEKLKRFTFNAMLLEDTLFDMHKAGISVKDGVQQTPVTRVTKSDFSPIIWRQALEMSSVYVMIYCIENTLRNFVVDRLSERYGLDWWESCVSKNIKNAVQKLKASEEKTNITHQEEIHRFIIQCWIIWHK